MNGTLILYNLERDKDDYFESFFFRKRSYLADKNSIHLASLFSLAIELDQGNGAFKNYKKIRNLMEHDFFPVSADNAESMALSDFEKFTFELLKITRSAIFSFVFLIRNETIIEEKTNR